MFIPQPFNYARPYTKSDTIGFPQVENMKQVAVYVGTTGDAVFVFNDGTTATFVGIPAGTVVHLQATRINSSSTTAGAFVLLYQF